VLRASSARNDWQCQRWGVKVATLPSSYQDLRSDSESDHGKDEVSQIMEMDVDDGMLARMPPATQLETRWLGHVSREELFEQYEFWHLAHGSGKPAGKTTFKHTMVKYWRGVLKIRAERHHAQCHECAKLSEMRLKAESSAERTELQAAREKRLMRVLADRSVDAKDRRLSRE